MKIQSKVTALLLFSCLLASAIGCGGTGTTLLGAWADPTFTAKPIQSFMVVGVSENDGARRAFETAMSEELINKGANAVPSYKSIPNGKDLTEETLRAELEGKSIEAVLVTRLVSVDKEEQYVPGSSYSVPSYGYYGNMYGYGGYYSTAYSTVYEPGYTVENTIVVLETNVYETKAGELIWSAQSESFNPSDRMEIIDALSWKVADNLELQGLVQKPKK